VHQKQHPANVAVSSWAFSSSVREAGDTVNTSLVDAFCDGAVQ